MDNREILGKVFTIALTMWGIRWIMQSGKNEKAVGRGNTLVFRGSRVARWFTVMAMTVFLGAGLYTAIFTSEPWWISTIFLSLFILGYFGWPWAIMLDSVGIKQRSYWGRWKMIPWSDVTGLVDKGGYNGLVICGLDETTIRHYPYHVDQKALISELRKRAPRLLG